MSNIADTLMAEKRSRKDNGALAKDVLLEFQSYYQNMDQFRRDYFRCKKFVAGDQWSDITCYKGRKMTEQEMIESQGRYAVVNNFLKILIRNYKGTYIKQDLEPTCQSRSSDNQPVADVLSTALQYLWDLNSQKELNAAVFEEGLKAPLFVEKVSIGIMNGKYDVWSEPVDVVKFVVDSNTRDPRGMDVECVGEIHDMTLNRVLSSFAESARDRKRIEDIYKGCSRSAINGIYRQFGKIKEDNDFFFPGDMNLCRVFEIWRKEFRDGYWCHDFLTGDLYSVGNDEIGDVLEENKRRISNAREMGVSETDIKAASDAAENDKSEEEMPKSLKLIKFSYFYEDYWYYRFIAPNGEVIREGESPYAHGGHPYVFRFYPVMGGEAQSFISDVIDLQKDINRMDAMYDWIMRHSAKGALLFPKDQMDEEDGWTLKKYGDAWAQPDSVIPYNPKAGYSIPQQISKNNTDIGITQMLTSKMQWIQDISGVQGTLQGKQGYAGTSGSLYAQQTMNATTSLLDLLNIFTGFTKELAMKQVKCMQQIYDVQKWTDICGSYGVEIANLKGIKDADVNVRITESASSQVYRGVMNDELKWMAQMGFIDAYTYMNNSTLPFGWRLRREMEEKAASAEANGQEPLPTSVPQQQSMPSIQGANSPYTGENNLYNQMVAKNKD